jgi:hypothetical protein
MDAPERGALKLVWCIAGTLVFISVVEIGLYLTVCLLSKPPKPVDILPLVWKSITALVGVVVALKARSIAEWISDTLDL